MRIIKERTVKEDARGARKRENHSDGAIASSQRVPFPLKYDSPLGFPFSILLAARRSYGSQQLKTAPYKSAIVCPPSSYLTPQLIKVVRADSVCQNWVVPQCLPPVSTPSLQHQRLRQNDTVTTTFWIKMGVGVGMPAFEREIEYTVVEISPPSLKLLPRFDSKP
ncbi:hypothetical protein CDAR_18511 [Caerostris darwini]|uniref:Uncharacterized protein n=1 Tax=Caerostris darwini TaxID=1538125 RepID=A0AAV4V992_9ARAC|nr:hypothetical protein CDAR_18511 [Caerostris darwini]